jgi:hypothetical protein
MYAHTYIHVLHFPESQHPCCFLFCPQIIVPPGGEHEILVVKFDPYADQRSIYVVGRRNFDHISIFGRSEAFFKTKNGFQALQEELL